METCVVFCLSLVERPNNRIFWGMAGLKQRSVALGPSVESQSEISIHFSLYYANWLSHAVIICKSRCLNIDFWRKRSSYSVVTQKAEHCYSLCAYYWFFFSSNNDMQILFYFGLEMYLCWETLQAQWKNDTWTLNVYIWDFLWVETILAAYIKGGPVSDLELYFRSKTVWRLILE